MKSMIVLLGDKSDPGSDKQSYRIAMPAQIEEVINQVYPLPDGTWRWKGSHDVAMSGCKVVRAGDLGNDSFQEVWVWNGYRFRRSKPLKLTADDQFPELRYAKTTSAQLLPNGAGPYCSFIVPDLPTTSGLYVFLVDGQLRYIGLAENLKQRFYGYGHISPRNCFVGGRSTNIRMNKRIRQSVHDGDEIEVYIHETAEYKSLESTMIAELQPPWNVQGIKN